MHGTMFGYPIWGQDGVTLNFKVFPSIVLTKLCWIVCQGHLYHPRSRRETHPEIRKFRTFLQIGDARNHVWIPNMGSRWGHLEF